MSKGYSTVANLKKKRWNRQNVTEIKPRVCPKKNRARPVDFFGKTLCCQCDGNKTAGGESVPEKKTAVVWGFPNAISVKSTVSQKKTESRNSQILSVSWRFFFQTILMENPI